MYQYSRVCSRVCVYVPIKAILHQPRTLPLARYVILSWVEPFPYRLFGACLYFTLRVTFVTTGWVRYVWSSHNYSRVWINRVRLPILLVFSWTGKINIPLSPYVPENLVSRDGFVRQSRLASACSSPYSGWIWCLLTGFLPSSAAASIYDTALRHRASPEFIESHSCVPMTFTAESPPAQGPLFPTPTNGIKWACWR